MKITVLGETVAMEGVRLIRKEVRVFTLRYPLEEKYGDYTVEEKIYHNPKVVIDKVLNKTFEGYEFDDYVEIDMNKPINTDYGI